MSHDDGLWNEMNRMRRSRAPFPLDDDTATRLLDGHLGPADAPPGYAALSRVLAAAAAPAHSDELANEAPARAAFSAARRAGDARRGATPRPRHAVLALAAATLVVLLGAAVAAAATGSLPAGIQDTAHDVLANLGVSVPRGGHPGHGTDTTATTAADASTTTSSAKGPDATGPAKFGLCQAYFAGSGDKAHATAFKALAAAAAGSPGATDAERITAFCQGVTPGGGTTPTSPTAPTHPNPSQGNGNGQGNGKGQGNGNRGKP